jgi:Lar family restriction alleviation protein
MTKYLIPCCGRVVDTDNKPIWCIKCGEFDIDVVEFTKDTVLPCPFCGGEGIKQSYSTIDLYWIECDNEDCDATSGSGYTEQEAIGKWNRRV